MNTTIECRKAKGKETLYLCRKGKDGKLNFINLVKDNKRWIPNDIEVGSYKVDFASYKEDKENRRVTLFDINAFEKIEDLGF